jgi:hypothetical protein
MLWKHVAYWLRLAELYFLMAWWWDADGFEAYASVPPEETPRLAYGSSPHRLHWQRLRQSTFWIGTGGAYEYGHGWILKTRVDQRCCSYQEAGVRFELRGGPV